MTISSTTNRVSFAGNGVTVAFATSPVVFFDSADLTVYDVVTATGVSTLKTLTTDYTVTGGSGSTGTVTMLVAPATGHTLLIVRDVAITQGSDFVNNDASDAEVQEDALDRLTMIAQQLDTRVDRAFRLADSDVSGVSVELPDATTRALQIMGFDASGGFTLYPEASAVSDDASVAMLLTATGAVATTLHAWAAKHAINVKADFGAIGDGVTDDTAAIQAALTFAGTSSGGEFGRMVFFPTGLYKLSSKLTITANGVSMLADGTVRLLGDSVIGDYMLGVGGNSGSPINNNRILGNFVFYRGSTNAGGGAIEWSYAHYGQLNGTRYYNGRAPLLVHDCTGMLVEDQGFFETIAGGIGASQYLARFHTCAQLVVRKMMNFASFATKANTKVIIDFNCDDVKVTECTVGQITLTRTAVGGTFAPRWVTIDKCYGESNYEIAAFDVTYGKSVRITNCTGNAGLVGVNLNTNALGVDISGCTFLENQNDGILIQGGSYIQIYDNDISSNNKAVGASFSGIRFTANANNVDIVKNRIKNHIGSSYTHAYGILTTGGGTISYLNVEDNDIADFVTAAFTDGATTTHKTMSRRGALWGSAINTQTGATYTVLPDDGTIVANRAGTVTLTLESAATVPGRMLFVRTVQAQTVVSATSNVTPLAGGSDGTAILAATAGKWALLQATGSSWQIIAAA